MLQVVQGYKSVQVVHCCRRNNTISCIVGASGADRRSDNMHCRTVHCSGSAITWQYEWLTSSVYRCLIAIVICLNISNDSPMWIAIQAKSY